MKIYRKHGAWILQSESLVKFFGFLAVGRHGAKKAKGAAIFPFVVLRKSEYAKPLIINHEKIHFRQQLETLFIGAFLLGLFEGLYARYVLRLKAPDYYLYRAAEQEAYRNQHNIDYLKNRKWFSLFKYIKDKKKMQFVKGREPEVIVGDQQLTRPV